MKVEHADPLFGIGVSTMKYLGSAIYLPSWWQFGTG
jgi:hypothetical protein